MAVMTLPPQKFIDAAHAPRTKVTRRIDIFESDATTLWKGNVGFIDGNVQVDLARDERRMLDVVLDNTDQDLKVYPDGLWYDKIIVPYRGIVAEDGTTWERKLGEFFIDSADQSHFPHTVNVQARDRTKRLLGDKLAVQTAFAKNQPIEEIIRTLALNGGVPSNKIDLPLTGKSTAREYVFDADTERWAAMKEIATSFGYDLFFNSNGVLRLMPQEDPATMLPEFTFKTGPTDGNLATYAKRVHDTRLYNHIVVTGEEADGKVPVWAIAENTDATSPTSVSAIGRRTYRYTSSFITTTAQAQDVADKFLKSYALQSFELDLGSLVAPWFEAGAVIQFDDPSPAPGDPDRYLLSNFSVPLSLGPMGSKAKRVLVVS